VGPAPRIRGTRFRVVAAPTPVGVETHARATAWAGRAYARIGD